MVVTQSSDGKQVVLSDLVGTLGVPTKIEISKGFASTSFIQVSYISGDSYTLDYNTNGIESFFDSNNRWIDDIYELKIKYVTSITSGKFLTDFTTKQKIYTIIGKIPYDVKFGYQFDKNAEYGAYCELMYKALKVAESKSLWERANYILKSLSKINTNYTYR